jgi:subtilase family serine protease
MGARLPTRAEPDVRGPMKATRLSLTAAAAAVVVLATSVVAASGAAVAASTTDYSKRVCSHAATGYAACDAHVRTNVKLKPLATTGPTGYSPTQLRTAYGITSTGSATTTVALVDAFAHPNALADLTAYRNQFGLGAPSLTQVNQAGGSIGTVTADVGWGQEEMLDLEMVSAMCPACKILYVGATSASFTDLAAAVNRAAALGAKVISNSYGGAEFSTETTLASAYSHSGVAITASSGDSGFGAQAPAAFNTLTAVGGTSLRLTASGARLTETAWSGAGSGCSAFISKPSWQHDPACTRRTIADVSAVADPNTGVSVYDSFGSAGGANWFVFGGTSVAAPLVGGIYALGSTAGVPAQLSYPNAGALFDVKSGSNGRCARGTGAYLCTSVAGYDGPTGNGSPNGSLAPF